MRPVSRVTLLVDDENAITAGDDTGLELTADCPHATQEMVNAILESVKGYQYQMYTADAISIDPLAELGDGITAGGIYSVISRLDDDGSGYPDAEAPGAAETEDEFPTSGPITQAINQTNRKIAQTRSEITKTAEEIRLSVKSVEERVEQAESDLSVQAEQISAKVSATSGSSTSSFGWALNADSWSLYSNGSEVLTADKDGLSVTGTVEATSGAIGGWDITNNGITYTSSDGLNTVTIRPIQYSKNSSVFLVTTRDPETGEESYPFYITGNGAVVATKVTVTGTVNSDSNSTLGGTLNGVGGSLSGVTGSYNGSIYSSGSYFGGIYGSSSYENSGLLSNCNLGSTALRTVSGGAYFSVYGDSGAEINGSNIHIGNRSANLDISSWSVFNGNVTFYGGISVSGQKDRIIRTDNYGTRCLGAYETPVPTFSDYGNAILDDSGVCYIIIDPVFAETINIYYAPTVFLTKYGQGDIWVDDVSTNIAVIRGTPGLKFAWETRYAQGNISTERLRVNGFDQPDFSNEHDFADEARVYIAESFIDYAQQGYEYYTNFERRFTA